MDYRTGSWVWVIALLWVLPAAAATRSTDEFVVPLQTTPEQSFSVPQDAIRLRTVKDKVTGEAVLQAKTAQAAIAAAIGQRTAGCRAIRFGAGFGWVATGTAVYPASDNPVALRRSRQEARFKAFTDASTRFTGCWVGLQPEARQRITASLEQNDAVRLALINLAFTEADKREQAFKILSRGFVAYSVEDDPEQRTIYVNLVTTPKTATRLTRPAASAVEAVSLQEGLRQIQAEVRAGLIPPMGNRLVVVNATGELALVGYAVNLIGVHPNPAAQDKLRSDAEKIATNRATEALIGLAVADDAPWQKALDEASRSDVELLNSNYGAGEPSVVRFAQIREFMMNNLGEEAGIVALREGRLPSLALKRFGGTDHVVVMVTYTPVVKKRPPAPAAPPIVPSINQPAPLVIPPEPVRGKKAETPLPSIAPSPPITPPTLPPSSVTPPAAPSLPLAPPAAPSPPNGMPVVPSRESTPKGEATPAATMPTQSPGTASGTASGTAKPVDGR